MKRIPYFLTLLLALTMLAMLAGVAQAAPSPQLPQVFTPTPGPDGRILYIVQAGDSCLRISALFGVATDQLIALNRLDGNCTLVEGQELLLGFGGPANASPTPPNLPTATPAGPTPTPFVGTARVCVLLYEDLNGDSLRQETEPAIGGGQVGLTSQQGNFARTVETVAGLEPVCFEDVPEATYSISIASPDTYNLTTLPSDTIEVKAGYQMYLRFSAQSSLGSGVTEETGTTPLLGILGGLFFVLGAGLGAYAWLSRRR